MFLKVHRYIFSKSSDLFLKAVILLLLLNIHTPCISQNQEEEEEHIEKPVKNIKKSNPKGFHAGFFIGTFFANSATAGLYDGYGFDMDGKKNDFLNSFMYRKIVNEYGGGYGQTDYIAQELNVAHGEWFFDEGDMPINLVYNTAFMMGVQTRFGINKTESLLLNVNGSKLNVSGNFTITTINTTSGAITPSNIQTFSISGGEERLMFQLGYQRILGDNDMLNFFIEAGPSLTFAKFDRNTVTIKNLNIDLTSYYYLPGFAEYRTRSLTGVGIGAFAGLGLNLSMSSKWTVQLIYNPSYEKINIGENPTTTLQNSLGLRAYYNL